MAFQSDIQTMARFFYSSILLVTLALSGWPQEQSRFTMMSGDIFLGRIVGEENERYWIDRGIGRHRVPKWWIKSIEPGAPLRSPEEVQRYPYSGDLQMAGVVLSVTARTPVQPSHLELYPAWSFSYIRAGRYLRGYLVNETDQGFSTVQVQILMYGDNNSRIHEKFTEVFKVYPHTMKPFIIDCDEVKWDRVRKMSIFPIGWSRLPRVDDRTF